MIEVTSEISQTKASDTASVEALLDSAGYSVSHYRDWCRSNEESDVDKFISYVEGLKSLEIDETNFDQYFFDAKKHKPRPGQVLACYDAKADFVDGNLKRDIIHLLMTKNKASESCVRLMQKVGGATMESAVAVVKQMMSDLLGGMSTEAVAVKPYDFQCQYFYYTYRQCLPENDPHWWSTSLVDVRKFDNDGNDL